MKYLFISLLLISGTSYSAENVKLKSIGDPCSNDGACYSGSCHNGHCSNTSSTQGQSTKKSLAPVNLIRSISR